MTGREVWSLRRRLAAWLLVPMVLVSTVLFLDAYRGTRAAADRAYDRLIAASALAIADRVIAVGGSLDVDLPYVALEMLSTETHDRVFYRIAGPGGALVTGYADLPLPPGGEFPDQVEPVFYDARYLGEPIRIAAITQPVTGTGAASSGRFVVQVAQTRGERDLLVRELATATAIRFAALIVLIAACTWFGIRFGLAPLARLRSAIRERSPQDLGPLDVAVPREVRDLVAGIDVLMARLSRALSAMEQFISDAAHQLRTPLAALHTQVELALRESDPRAFRAAVLALQGSTRRTSRLARQLLNLAHSTADARSAARERLNLRALVADVTRELVPTALAGRIDLGFEDDGGPSQVSADPLLLRELVKNLVDNALRYCAPGASVTVRVGSLPAGRRVRLEVEDDGPGIAAHERVRVLERFYRVAGSAHEGSGLGLAIVREIAERHGGVVELLASPSGGLLVRVEFPPAPTRVADPGAGQG